MHSNPCSVLYIAKFRKHLYALSTYVRVCVCVCVCVFNVKRFISVLRFLSFNWNSSKWYNGKIVFNVLNEDFQGLLLFKSFKIWKLIFEKKSLLLFWCKIIHYYWVKLSLGAFLFCSGTRLDLKYLKKLWTQYKIWHHG